MLCSSVEDDEHEFPRCPICCQWVESPSEDGFDCETCNTLFMTCCNVYSEFIAVFLSQDESKIYQEYNPSLEIMQKDNKYIELELKLSKKLCFDSPEDKNKYVILVNDLPERKYILEAGSDSCVYLWRCPKCYNENITNPD